MIQCSTCNDEAVAECEGCGEMSCRSCFISRHKCGNLIDGFGRMVREGDILRYLDAPARQYRLVKTEPSFLKLGWSRAVSTKRTAEPGIVRPSLMEVV